MAKLADRGCGVGGVGWGEEGCRWGGKGRGREGGDILTGGGCVGIGEGW